MQYISYVGKSAGGAEAIVKCNVEPQHIQMGRPRKQPSAAPPPPTPAEAMLYISYVGKSAGGAEVTSTRHAEAQ